MKDLITNFSFRIANNENDFDEGRNLFNQYADSLDINLDFQNFKNELQTIEKLYNKPTGALILAIIENVAIGCVGVRKLDNDTVELKRMYIIPKYRGYKLGAELLKLAIDYAKELNYKKIRLDTLPNMTTAQNLYHSFGFYEIHAYCFNPVIGTIFMEKELN